MAFSPFVSLAGELAKGSCQSTLGYPRNDSWKKKNQHSRAFSGKPSWHVYALLPFFLILPFRRPYSVPKGTNAQQLEKQGPERK